MRGCFIGDMKIRQTSENGNWIEERSSPSRQAKRRSNDEEFPSAFLFADGGNVFKIEAIGTNHPHGCDLECVNRISDTFDSTRNSFTVAGREKGCDFTVVEECNRRGA